MSVKLKQPQYYRVATVRHTPLSAEEEHELFSAYRRRRTAGRRDAIVRQYLHWAAEIACRYCGPRMSKPEAISAANYGLMQAIEGFDPDAGKRFVTYSYFAIRREVLYALRDSYVVNPESGLWAAKYEFSLSEKTDEDRDRLKKRRLTVFDSVSAPLQPVGHGLDASRGHESFSDEDVGRSAELASMMEALQDKLPVLPKELRRVIELKYFSAKPMTFVEIGEKLKCAPDHVRWLHGRALKVLQKLLRPVKKEL